MSKAREAAARAIHDRYEQITHWVKTLGKEPRPMETSGIKEVHRLDANAAIDAFLASLSEDEDMVERVAKAIDDAINAGPSRETWSAKDGEMEISDRLARAAIAAMWDMAPEVKP